MIPRANITAWRKTAPWPDNAQVELQKQGKPAKFPVGAFPPGLPYVRGKMPLIASAA